MKTKLVLYTTPLGERGGCLYSFLIYSVAILAQVLPFASGFMLLFFSGSTRAILLGLGALRTHSTIVPFGRGSSARLLSVYLLSTIVVVAAIIAAILGPVFSGSSLGRGRGLHGSAGARTATTTTTSCKQSAPLAEILCSRLSMWNHELDICTDYDYYYSYSRASGSFPDFRTWLLSVLLVVTILVVGLLGILIALERREGIGLLARRALVKSGLRFLLKPTEKAIANRWEQLLSGVLFLEARSLKDEAVQGRQKEWSDLHKHIGYVLHAYSEEESSRRRLLDEAVLENLQGFDEDLGALLKRHRWAKDKRLRKKIETERLHALPIGEQLRNLPWRWGNGDPAWLS